MFFIERVKEIFEQLQSTTSKKGKEQILKDNVYNKLVGLTLQFLLDPYITTGLSGKKMHKVVSVNPTQDFDDGRQVMLYLANNNTGTDQIIANVQNFIAKQPENMQDFYYSLFTKNLKLGCAANTVNKVYGKGYVPQFHCMLAEKYFDHANKVEGKDFTLTLKLDGIRCLAVKKGNSVKLFSRQGQPIEGLADVETELLKHSNRDFVLDGELLIADVSGIPSKEQYKATTRIVRKDGEKHGIIFRAFDHLNLQEFLSQDCAEKYIDRRKTLESVFNGMRHLEVLPALYTGNDTAKIIEFLDKVRSDEQEGLILNLNDAPYEFKRTQNLLKVKVMSDCDLKIVGFEEGQGRLAGTLGRINVGYRGNIVGVGSGFTDVQREWFWKNQRSLLGRIVTISYFEETQDKSGNISLRFPVFKGLREYGKEVSYS